MLEPNLSLDSIDGLCESLDVASGDTSDGDTAVLGGVDGKLVDISQSLIPLLPKTPKSHKTRYGK
jgi:hypothetical protein